MKKTLEGINNVLARKLKNTRPITFIKDPNDNDSVTSDPSRIANVLIDHFASVGPKLANKLQTVQRNYFDFMNGSNSRDSSFSTYNTRHKSFKQEPLVLNFLQISYIHSSHLCSHSNVPLSFPNVEPSVFWSTKMTANPNQHWGGENHTSVSRFVTKIVVTSNC